MTDPDCSENDFCNREREEFLYDEIIDHKSYNSSTHANDIALVRLSKDIYFGGEYIKPICLPIANHLNVFNLSSSYFIVSGWGITENNATSEDLLKADLAGITIQSCRKALRSNELNSTIQFCTKGMEIIDTLATLGVLWFSQTQARDALFSSESSPLVSNADNRPNQNRQFMFGCKAT